MFRFFVLLIVGLSWPFICYASDATPLPKLSLNDAILLAVRENPNVQTAKLNDVMQKFALYVQHWQFQPHYAFQSSYNFTSNTSDGIRTTSNTKTIVPAVSLLTPIGTQLTLTSTNPLAGHYNPAVSLQVMQPLMQGFGRAIVEIALYNAMDSETISRLNIEGTLRTTITGVINAYLNVVLAQYTLKIDEQALQRALKSVQQTKLFIKAGHKAGVELVTVEADVASAQANIENDKNALLQARYALLTAIGIDPNTNVQLTDVDVPALIKKYRTPNLAQSKEMTLQNNIQYQVDKITLSGSLQRSLLQAEDNTRWQLNFNLTATTGGGNGGGQNAGINSLTNGANKNYSAGLNLVIPIDNQAQKQAVVNAKISIKQAKLALLQERWTIETSAINGWNNIYSTLRAYRFADRAEKLQDQTYQISFAKYAHGLIDSLALQTAQQELIASQQRLIRNRINYLESLVNMDQIIGTTLKTWGVTVRYSGDEGV